MTARHYRCFYRKCPIQYILSRIGKKPIFISQGMVIDIDSSENIISVRGPKGELKRKLPDEILVEVKENNLFLTLKKYNKKAPALWGLSRSLVANMIEGVTKGFERKLEFEGIGFRVSVEGDNLILNLGFSHPVRFTAPPGISFSVAKNVILVSGIDKELVGNIAASIRKLKPSEPYKGKGIRYQGEIIKRKAGKKAVAAT